MESVQLPVSVIIAARNEARNLENFLPLILNQDYPEFQVVVVNDRSWDQTGKVLEMFEKQYDHLHIITVHDNDLYKHGKKMAITLGVKGAKYETLLFTDADCKPVSKNWIKSMVSGLNSKSIVLGYSRYEKTKGLLNKMIRYDGVQIASQYLSSALAGDPYMGVGRNLMYKKSLFEKEKGFKKHYHIQSGDDDLFINAVANKENTSICVNEDSFTESLPKKTFGEWWIQKKRHATTGSRYKLRHIVLLSVYPLTFLLFIAGVVVSLFGPWIWVVCGLYFTRITIQLLIFQSTYKKLAARDLVVLSPILELIFVIINPLIHISNVFVKPKRWA